MMILAMVQNSSEVEAMRFPIKADAKVIPTPFAVITTPAIVLELSGYFWMAKSGIARFRELPTMEVVAFTNDTGITWQITDDQSSCVVEDERSVLCSDTSESRMC